MKKAINVLCVFSLFLLACNQTDRWDKSGNNSKNDLVQNLGISKTIQVNEIRYSVEYRPTEAIIETERLSDKEQEKRLEELSEVYWFNIKISVDGFDQSPLRYGINNLDEFNQRLDYYLNYAMADIWITCQKDTLMPISYLFENNQNLISHETIIVGFDKTKIQGNVLQLAFNDRVLKSGIIKATFNIKDLNKTAELTD